MNKTRVFESSKYFQPSDKEPIRSVITESSDAIVVAWYVKPGQRLASHIHPHGEDIWTILSGRGEYYQDQTGTSVPIGPGDVVVARAGEIHGAMNTGNEPLIFVSVISPPEAGFQLVE